MNSRERQSGARDVASVEAAIQEAQWTVDRMVLNSSPLRILEADCGSCSKFSFPEPVHVTGIDISEKQLDRNVGLQEKIRGDLPGLVRGPLRPPPNGSAAD